LTVFSAVLALSLVAEAAPPKAEVEIPIGEQIRQMRTTDAVNDFFADGETRGLGRVVAVDPTSSASVSFSRQHHWASETVTIDGVTVSSQSGGEVVHTITETNERGKVTTTTRRYASGDMPAFETDSLFDW